MHSFDRFYIGATFLLPTVDDLNFLPIDINEKSDYLNADLSPNQYWKEYITKFKFFVRKLYHL